MTRHGLPIRTVRTKHAISTGISYSLTFEEWDACVTCGLDLERWVNNDYPLSFKARVVAFHRSRKLVELHTTDASIPKPKKRRDG